MMDKINWLKAILQCIIELCDKEFQKRVWIEGKGPEISSFDELMCRLFDDYDFEKSIYVYDISDEVRKNLIELSSLLSDQKEVDTIRKLNTEEWNNIIQKTLISKEEVENEILSLLNSKDS
jgi:hypothetical protein